MTATIKQTDLAHFSNGTSQWYRHWAFPHVMFTDGIKYLFDNGAAWLIDKIALEQAMHRDEFQVWKCHVDDTNKMSIDIEDGNNNLLRTAFVDFTDFPLKEITIWVVDKVILLPSEY